MHPAPCSMLEGLRTASGLLKEAVNTMTLLGRVQRARGVRMVPGNPLAAAAAGAVTVPTPVQQYVLNKHHLPSLVDTDPGLAHFRAQRARALALPAAAQPAALAQYEQDVRTSFTSAAAQQMRAVGGPHALPGNILIDRGVLGQHFPPLSFNPTPPDRSQFPRGAGEGDLEWRGRVQRRLNDMFSDAVRTHQDNHLNAVTGVAGAHELFERKTHVKNMLYRGGHLSPEVLLKEHNLLSKLEGPGADSARETLRAVRSQRGDTADVQKMVHSAYGDRGAQFLAEGERIPKAMRKDLMRKMRAQRDGGGV